MHYSLREVAVGSLYDEMIVVVHKAVAMTDPVISLIDTGKGIKEREPVFITPKDRLAGIAPGGYVINRTVVFYP